MLKGIILSGCIVGIAASLIDASVSEKYRRHIRTVIALILIIVVLQPFLKVDFGSLIAQYIEDFESRTIYESQQTMAQSVVSEAQEDLSEYLSAKLEAAGIKPQSVCIELTVTEDGHVQVSRTDIILSRDQLGFYDEAKRIAASEFLQGTVNISWTEAPEE